MKKFPSRLGGGAASFCGGVFSLFCLSFIKTCDFRKTRIFTIDKIHERSYNETKFRAVCCLGKSVNPFGVVPPFRRRLTFRRFRDSQVITVKRRKRAGEKQSPTATYSGTIMRRKEYEKKKSLAGFDTCRSDAAGDGLRCEAGQFWQWRRR